ncbi:7263_t:CDS:2, partial [Rhizophagus irregularis]
VRTEILTAFLTNLKKLDWSQINAAKIVWSNCKIQLCLWHAKKSIKKKLADNSEPKYNAYNPIEANSQFSFIDILWCPIIPPNLPFIFCPKTLQVKILELFTKHFHLHPLIPIGSGEFLSSEDIWKLLTEEMYNFCYENDLKYVWAYMWCNWYKFNLW